MNETKADREEELPALFADDIPDKLTKDMLALAHLSDVEEEKDEEMVKSGPIRRRRKKIGSKPYKKSEDEEFIDDMKELEFRTNAWKPFKTQKKS
jgi:hypothetical protein